MTTTRLNSSQNRMDKASYRSFKDLQNQDTSIQKLQQNFIDDGTKDQMLIKRHQVDENDETRSKSLLSPSAPGYDQINVFQESSANSGQILQIDPSKATSAMYSGSREQTANIDSQNFDGQ